ncbi:MAG: hypothetical protein DMD89_28650 [Candidatus Rokuibacteriota bacterium]|nr:MAG: hypothetical protein DMD89_28650 [Candidatus Rokubacteria bacterium]
MTARVLSMLAMLAALWLPAGLPAAWGQAPPGSTAPSKAPPAPTATEKPAPQSIPVPEVARRADDIGKELRDLETLAVPSPAIGAIEKRLPEITAQIVGQTETSSRLLDDAQPVAATLDGIATQWQATRAELAGYVTVLAERATAIEEALKNLTANRERWTRARADAVASRAPAQVIERIDGVLTAVAAARARLQTQRGAILILQDRVAQEVGRCEDMLGRVASLRRGIAGRLFTQDSVPLWDTRQRASAFLELPDRIRSAIAADVAQLRQFVGRQGWKAAVQVAIFLGLVLLMSAVRRGASQWAGSAELETTSVLVFARPISAALVLTVLLSGWIYLIAPVRAIATLGKIVVLLPALRITRLSLDPVLVRMQNVIGAFFLAEIIRNFASVVPLLEQQIFLLEMAAGMVVLGWWLVSRRRQRPAGAISSRERALRLITRVVLAVFAVAFAAGAAGDMTLGLLLGSGVLGTGYLALVLYGGLRVASALVAFAFRVRPLCSLGMVQRHRALLERRTYGVLRGLGVVALVIVSLRYLGLWPATVELIDAAMDAHLQRGTLSISLGDVLVFAITVAGSFILSGLLRFALDEDVYPRLTLGRGLTGAVSSLLHYALLLAGLLLALAALGVDLTKLTILAGAFGVGIGFGLQTVVNNFVSGLLILFERRIDVGDAIQVGDVAGQVQQLGMRACTVRTGEGAEVIVPNASMISEKVTNWTLSDRLRRIDVGVGVAYGTPPEKMLEILLEVARAHPLVLADPAPAAFFLGFGESALRFEVRTWTDRFDLWAQTQSELAVALYAALGEAGFEIPLPQRDVRVRDGDRGALKREI